MIHTVAPPRQRALLVAVDLSDRARPLAPEFAEFAALARATGVQIVGEVIQRLPHVDPATLVGSGGYTLERVDPDAITLKANPHYWAGKPAIETVHMVTTLNGGSPVEAFESGDLDVSQIGWFDANWIAYNATLGPSLRSERSLSVVYYGFEARKPPFDKADVRRAFAQAVDWRRLASLALLEARAGERADADRALAEFLRAHPGGLGHALARVHAQRGEGALAFGALDQAVADRDPGLHGLASDYWLYPLHGYARYRALTRRLGLS